MSLLNLNEKIKIHQSLQNKLENWSNHVFFFPPENQWQCIVWRFHLRNWKCDIIFSLKNSSNGITISWHSWELQPRSKYFAFVFHWLSGNKGTRKGNALYFPDCGQAKSTCAKVFTPHKLPATKKSFLLNTNQFIHYRDMNWWKHIYFLVGLLFGKGGHCHWSSSI